MKLSLSISTCFFSLALLLAASLHAETAQLDSTSASQGASEVKKKEPRFVQEYHDPILFMKDFLDYEKTKPGEPLAYWAFQLIQLLKTDPKLINFCKTIRDIAVNKDLSHEVRTRSINDAFFHAYLKNLFSEEFSKFILSQGLPKVGKAIKERAAVIERKK